MRYALLSLVLPLAAALVPRPPQNGSSAEAGETSHEKRWMQGYPGMDLASPDTRHVDYQVFKDFFVNWHNFVRRQHEGTGDLVWDETLAEDARRWSRRCVFEHGHSPGFPSNKWGQKIAYQAMTFYDGQGRVRRANRRESRSLLNPFDQVLLSMQGRWEWERFLLDWKTFELGGWAHRVVHFLKGRDSRNFIVPQVGHFTQLIWKRTSHVGCAVAVCPRVENPKLHRQPSMSLASYTVCNYANGGNIYWRGSDPKKQYRENVGLPWDWNQFQRELHQPTVDFNVRYDLGGRMLPPEERKKGRFWG